MTRYLLALSVLVCLANPSFAQEKAEGAGVDDLEIMRHIFQKRLQSVTMNSQVCLTCHAATSSNTSFLSAARFARTVTNQGTTSFGPHLNWNVHGHEGLGMAGMEGLRLPGYGVVFTLTTHVMAVDPRPSKAEPAPKQISEWERTRMQLEGKKPSTQPKQAKKSATVGDIVVDVLASNGQHLKGMDADDKVTVAISFRKSVTGLGGLSSSRTQWLHGTTVNSPLGARLESASRLATLGSVASQTQSKESLADLHIRNKKFTDAVKVFRELLANEKLDPKSRKRITGKLAQALISLGRIEESRALLAQLEKLDPGDKKAAPVGPARLTITATKKLLDQVGKGDISRDEFLKSLQIEYQPLSSR